VRDYGGRLSFDPRLPAGITRLRFPVVFRGRRLMVQVEHDGVTYALDEGEEAIEILHRGEPLTVNGGTAERRPLAELPEVEPPRQPRGREPARAKARAREADARPRDTT
jgi:alpha,alpha-trehalose phosphorylase